MADSVLASSVQRRTLILKYEDCNSLSLLMIAGHKRMKCKLYMVKFFFYAMNKLKNDKIFWQYLALLNKSVLKSVSVLSALRIPLIAPHIFITAQILLSIFV